MIIQHFQQMLDERGYIHAISVPDPQQDFTPATFGTLLWQEDGPELEIRLPDTATRHARVRAISVEQMKR